MTATAVRTLPALYYRDPLLHEKERKAVFAKSWLLICHESQLPSAGDYLAATVAGYPLLLVRGENNEVRAFHNVCRHRAGPLAEEGRGNCDRALVCRYHGWRYALDGRLASARDFGPARDFDIREFALFGVACEAWRGFYFIHIDAHAPPLETAIRPLAEHMAELPLESYRLVRHERHEVRCNWKTYVENYLEGYHVPLVHPALDSYVDATRYEAIVDAPVVIHRAPPKSGVPVAGFWAWAWPCLGINVYPNGVMMERMWPLDFAHTQLDYIYLFPEDAAQEEIASAANSSEVTTREDVRIVEAVQRNLNAGVYDKGRLSPKHEDGVAWFQQQLRRALDKC
jgi:choline monooxygenase